LERKEQVEMGQPEADRIVRSVLQGEVDAYQEIVRLYQGQVWKIAASCLQDRDATSDLVQEIFVEAYFALDRYQAGRDFGIWLRGIARNRLRLHLRDRGREVRLLEVYRGHLAGRLEGAEAAERAREALSEAHRACRGQLPAESARLLDLRYAQSLSHQDIAARLGRSMEAVKQLLYRIHVALRDCIEKRLAQA
jgi:RNA polymerase sigma-70 factor (ECF subfamily)